MMFDPDRVPVGVQTRITATFEWRDPDGDFEGVEVTLDFAGQRQSMETSVPGTMGAKQGSGALLLEVLVPEVMPLQLEFVAFDEEGNRADPITRTIEVFEPSAEGEPTG